MWDQRGIKRKYTQSEFDTNRKKQIDGEKKHLSTFKGKRTLQGKCQDHSHRPSH